MIELFAAAITLAFLFFVGPFVIRCALIAGDQWSDLIDDIKRRLEP